MITQPTTDQLIDVVRQELRDAVLPTVTDPVLQASLQMVDHVLATAARRAAHEIGWMTEEVAALVDLGTQVCAALDAPAVQQALDATAAADASSLHLGDVAHRYSVASEILSAAADVVPVDGSALRAAVEVQLDLRQAHEIEIMGEFQLVGRT